MFHLTPVQNLGALFFLDTFVDSVLALFRLFCYHSMYFTFQINEPWHQENHVPREKYYIKLF